MEKNLILKNCLIEDVVFVPRVLPFSFKNPIVKVACGNRFAVAIAKVRFFIIALGSVLMAIMCACVYMQSGSVYTWGAGECGQLGTGRCTNREIPAEVPFGGVKVIEVACGSGHVIALLERGTVCGWGLNKSGQLGLGDTATKFAPERGQRSFAKIFANGNSSAAIDDDGQLFTWGSRYPSISIHCFLITYENLHSQTLLHYFSPVNAGHITDYCFLLLKIWI